MSDLSYIGVAVCELKVHAALQGVGVRHGEGSGHGIKGVIAAVGATDIGWLPDEFGL